MSHSKPGTSRWSFLHHEDGTHRTSCPTTSGQDLARFDSAIQIHLAQEHHHLRETVVVLRVTWNPDEASSPERWDWPSLLDLPDQNDVEVISTQDVGFSQVREA